MLGLSVSERNSNELFSSRIKAQMSSAAGEGGLAVMVYFERPLLSNRRMKHMFLTRLDRMIHRKDLVRCSEGMTNPYEEESSA